MEGCNNAALGLATLERQTNGTELLIGNLGSSGQDGVAIELNRAEHWDVTWLGIGPA